MAHSHAASTPTWSWAMPLVSLALLGLVFTGALPESSALVLVPAAACLALSVFSAVHHAELLALKVGEPLGSLILAGAVTVIEVGLIVSVMLSESSGGEQVARDTIFSAVMIILNGVIGLSLVLGGGRHHEQSFRLDAASSALAVLGTLSVIVFVLPDFVIAGGDMQYASAQLPIVGIVCLVLYGTFVFVQTISHRDYFLEAQPSSTEPEPHPAAPPSRVTLAAAVLLPVSLVAVILLAKMLSHPLDHAIAAAGLPRTAVGVALASMVLLPEGIASVRSAMANRLQNSVNLILGSALASIGMTIPVVAGVALLLGKSLTLGLVPQHVVMLMLTLFLATITLGTGRTTLLQGVVHLGVFAVFLMLSIMP